MTDDEISTKGHCVSCVYWDWKIPCDCDRLDTPYHGRYAGMCASWRPREVTDGE